MTGSTAAERPRQRGPRGGDADTRGDILAAAAEAFATQGYGAASLRGIARQAGVDPALVRHYFGSKAELFVEAMRPLRADDAAVTALLATPAEQRGEAFIRLALSLWDDPVIGARLRAILASIAAVDDVGAAFAQVMMRDVLLRMVRPDHAEDRAAACATQIAGLAMGRYVLRVPSLADAPVERLAAIYGPTFQRYLDGDLDLSD
ncbi:TetR/AcrR family transcriptional regulator [Demequina lignilytica]|uniref:TetR family transcriptional regulator n=1 Tax=Demequina lignilytica TaxID=3051663 RepID=A0AB35MKE5_9MICO|nr:TetR family transcriptional regulator [Demequina sp. SYSU T0a273]MDN4484254.1 TetR family transcriptional regulator [Demequina sp. SYSU T0a273]